MDDETPIKKIDEKSSSATIRMIRFLTSKYEFRNNMVLNEVFAKEKEGNKYHPVNPHTLYIECRQEGYRTSVAEINSFLSSDFIPKTNLFVNYFKHVLDFWSEASHGDYIKKFTF